SHDHILLSLAYDPAHPHVVQASFELEQNGTLDESTLRTFNTTGTLIFNNENWARAQLFVEAPAQSDSVLQGTYGQLDITQAGAWTYQLANGQANVQALAAGVTVQDIFTAQVADGHGGFDTKTITVNVTGTNDAPVGTSPAQNGAIIGDTNIDDSGNLNVGGTNTFTEGDPTRTHTVTFTGRNDYVGTFSLDPITQDSTNGQTGSVVWHSSVSDHLEDSLAAGQTLTQTYTVKVADNNGGFTTQDVTITITGTNDAPVITSGAAAGSEARRRNSVSAPRP